MNSKNNIISGLIRGKKSIFNCKVKVSRRIFQLGGVGSKALKVRVNPPKNFPHLELSGFLDWDKWEEFTEQEKELVRAFYNELP